MIIIIPPTLGGLIFRMWLLVRHAQAMYASMFTFLYNVGPIN